MSKFGEESTDDQVSKQRAPMNRSLELTDEERNRLRPRLMKNIAAGDLPEFPTGTVQGDSLEIAKLLPRNLVDLLILDPPYNLTKDFDGYRFSKRSVDAYTNWLDEAIQDFQ